MASERIIEAGCKSLDLAYGNECRPEWADRVLRDSIERVIEAVTNPGLGNERLVPLNDVLEVAVKTSQEYEADSSDVILAIERKFGSDQ